MHQKTQQACCQVTEKYFGSSPLMAVDQQTLAKIQCLQVTPLGSLISEYSLGWRCH